MSGDSVIRIEVRPTLHKSDYWDIEVVVQEGSLCHKYVYAHRCDWLIADFDVIWRLAGNKLREAMVRRSEVIEVQEKGANNA